MFKHLGLLLLTAVPVGLIWFLFAASGANKSVLIAVGAFSGALFAIAFGRKSIQK